MTEQAFAMVPCAALLDRRLGHADKTLLGLIALHRNSRTGWAWPALKTLASEMGYANPASGIRDVRRALRRLEEAGYLRAALRPNNTSIYTVVLDRPPPTEEEIIKAQAEEGGSGASFPGGGNGSPEGEGNGSPEGPGNGSPPNQTKEPDKRTKQTSSSAARPNDGDPEGFAEWWKAYPNKVAKGTARKIYRRVVEGTSRQPPKATPAVLLAAVKAYPFKLNEPQFIPHPSTWLNGERWLEVPEAAPQEPETPKSEAKAYLEVLGMAVIAACRANPNLRSSKAGIDFDRPEQSIVTVTDWMRSHGIPIPPRQKPESAADQTAAPPRAEAGQDAAPAARRRPADPPHPELPWSRPGASGGRHGVA